MKRQIQMTANFIKFLKPVDAALGVGEDILASTVDAVEYTATATLQPVVQASVKTADSLSDIAIGNGKRGSKNLIKSLRYTLSTPINIISRLFTKNDIVPLDVDMPSKPDGTLERAPLSGAVMRTVKESIHSVGDTLSGTQNIAVGVINLATLNITDSTNDLKTGVKQFAGVPVKIAEAIVPPLNNITHGLTGKLDQYGDRIDPNQKENNKPISEHER